MNEGTFGSLLPTAGVRYANSACEICTAPSSGVHYGVVACEGCKAFYRRTLNANRQYRCFVGAECNVGPQAKGRCRACRYRKCVQLGMKLDASTKGRIPLRKRNVYRAVAELIPETSPDTTRSINGSPDTLPSLDAEDIVLFIRTSSLTRKTSASSFGSTSPEANEVDYAPVPEVTYCSPVTLLEQQPIIESVPTETTKDLLDEAISLRSSLQPIMTDFPVSSPMSSLSIAKYSQVCMDESFTGLSRDAMNWEAYSSKQPCYPDLETTMRSTINIHDTISAVASAIQSVYGADFAEWEDTMYDMMVNGNIPYQPQTSLVGYKENFAIAMMEGIKTHCNFCISLPGFSTFREEDQQILLREKWPEGFLVTRRHLFRGNQFYSLSGPHRIHSCIYWFELFQATEQFGLVFRLANAMNKLELTHVEAFLLYAISMLAPETTSVQDKPRLALLQSHYRDCLLHIIRSSNSRSCDGKGEQERQRRERGVLYLAEALRACSPSGHGYIERLEHVRESDDG